MTMSTPIACVRLPELPIVVHHTAAPGTATRPRSVHKSRGTNARILYCDASALHAGIRPGQTLAAALGRASTLESEALDARRLAEGQRHIVERLLGITPRITAAGADRFWVEPATVGRSRHAWEPRAFETFARDVVQVLHGRGPIAVGIGPDATVAWAAARSLGPEHTGHRVVLPERARSFLDGLPLEVLEIGSEALDILASLGIRRVGDLRAHDPVSLGMRFGPAVAEARRRADGIDPRLPATPAPTVPEEVRIELDDPLEGSEPLLFLLQPAAERLARTLRRRDRGAVEVRLDLKLATHPPHTHTITIRTGAPLLEGRPILELLRTRLERARLSAPVTAVRLAAARVTPTGERTEPLFRTAPPRDPGSQEVALDRLRARFGETSVRRAERVETGSVLERAQWLFAREVGEPAGGQAMPWRRIDPPAPVSGGYAEVGGRRRGVHKVGRVERVGSAWWDGGEQRVSLVAWAELEGPVLALLHAHCGTDHVNDQWKVIAWVD